MGAEMPAHCEFTATYPLRGMVTTWSYASEHDDALVVQVETRGGNRFRVNLNDWTIWDGDPDTDDPMRTLWKAKQELARALAADDLDDLRYAAEGLINAVDEHLRNLGVHERTYR